MDGRVLWTIVTFLYIMSPELIHFITGFWCLLTTFTHFVCPPAPTNWQPPISFLCVCVSLSFFFDVEFLKSLLNLLQYCFCFMFPFFGHKALAIWPGMEPTCPVLEDSLNNWTTREVSEWIIQKHRTNPGYWWLCQTTLHFRGTNYTGG